MSFLGHVIPNGYKLNIRLKHYDELIEDGWGVEETEDGDMLISHDGLEITPDIVDLLGTTVIGYYDVLSNTVDSNGHIILEYMCFDVLNPPTNIELTYEHFKYYHGHKINITVKTKEEMLLKLSTDKLLELTPYFKTTLDALVCNNGVKIDNGPIIPFSSIRCINDTQNITLSFCDVGESIEFKVRDFNDLRSDPTWILNERENCFYHSTSALGLKTTDAGRLYVGVVHATRAVITVEIGGLEAINIPITAIEYINHFKGYKFVEKKEIVKNITRKLPNGVNIVLTHDNKVKVGSSTLDKKSALSLLNILAKNYDYLESKR